MKLATTRMGAGFSLACLALAAPMLRAQGGTVTTTLSASKPPQEAIISHIGDEPGGWQWRWTDDTGRRDVGQTFTVTSAFTLDKISLAIRSGSNATVSRAPFTLTLSRYPNATGATPEEKLVTWRGELPDNANGAAYQQGTWLTFDIPDYQFQAGKVYGFTLQFEASKPTGQGIVFSIPQTEGFPSGRGVFSTDGQIWQHALDFNFVLLAAGATVPTPPTHTARILEVDKGGSTAYTTLASAAKVALPGDTIRIKANSGPYREILYVPTSGTAQAPITVEGNGNTITGFEPLTGWTTQNGVTTCQIPSFPCVITYNGERLVQDATTKQFTKYATINETNNTLTLLSGVSTAGWEISKRPFAVQITNTSYQTYKNIRASGSANDGFNLHGNGQGLLFENIEGFHNLDEGVSSHDTITSEINVGKFWGNDNGLANVNQSQTKMTKVDTWNNLGFGFWLNDCGGVAKDIRSWGNGADQVIFRNATASLDNVQAFTPASTTRPWLSYMESKPVPVWRVYSSNNSQLTGAVVIKSEAAPVG